MDIKEIQNLIKFVAKSGASEVKLEMEDVKITIKTGGLQKQHIVQASHCHAQMPASSGSSIDAPAPAAPAPAPAAQLKISKYHNYKVSNYWYFLQKTFSRQTYFCRSWCN